VVYLTLVGENALYEGVYIPLEFQVAFDYCFHDLNPSFKLIEFWMSLSIASKTDLQWI